jgi:hypothetical protein
MSGAWLNVNGICSKSVMNGQGEHNLGLATPAPNS